MVTLDDISIQLDEIKSELKILNSRLNSIDQKVTEVPYQPIEADEESQLRYLKELFKSN